MRPLLAFTFALLMLPAAVGARTDPDAALAGELKGLAPEGKTIACLPPNPSRETRIIDESRIVYRDSSRRVYLNTIPGGCQGLRPDRAILVRAPSGSTCSGDIITVFDPSSHVTYGSCALGDFQAYSR